MKKNNIFYLLMLLVLTGLFSCDKDDEIYPQLGDDPRNLTEVIESTSELSTLSDAMVQVNLDSVLRNTTTYTVFAPTNAAFDGVDISTYSETELENLLLNHVISTTSADFTSNLATGYVPTMATGPDGEFLDVFINNSGTVVVNGTASFVQGSYNIGTTNGVLHIIDGVLVPPTVADHTEANPNFSMLAAAVERAGLTETLSIRDSENESFPMTFFAPTNAAFENLMSQLNGAFGWATLEDVPVETLQEILMYHVVTGENILAATIAGTEQTTLQGDTFVIDENVVISDASYSTTNFVTPDIQGVNGIIHSIDKVLLPEEVFQSVLGATLDLKARAEDKGFTSFLAAAEKAGLTDLLINDELTAFIPNNDAFDAFFATIENFDSLEDFDTPEEIELLKNLIEYHLHEGLLMSSQLTNGDLSTLREDDLTVDVTAGALIPSHEYAPKATFVNTNIGATNAVIHEISKVLVSDADAAALGYPVPATDAPVFSFPVYYDGVEAPFQNTWGGWGGTWTWNSSEIVQNGNSAIKLIYNADAYGTLQIGTYPAGPNVSAYQTFHFSAYGAEGTGTTDILVSLCDCDAGVTVQVEEGKWTHYTLPLSSFDDKSMGAIKFKNTEASASTIYIDDIGFDLQAPAPSFGLTVYADGISDEWTAAGFNSTDWHYNTTVDWSGTANVFKGGAAGIVEQKDGGVLKFGKNAPGYDLSEYSEFAFTVLTADPANFTVVINGNWSGSYTTTTPTEAGEWTTVTIPLSEFSNDFSAIETIEFQINGIDASLFPYTYFIDEIGFN
jgi:uncharacterized surface protein with fasciclin (FAS1) repeats